MNIPYDLPTKDKVPSLSQLKSDTALIADLLSKAERHISAFNTARDKIANDFAKSFGTVSKSARDQVLAGKVMELRQGTVEALDALLKQAGAPKARRDAASAYLGDPKVTVNVATLADPKRTVYFNHLKHAGHASIRAAAVFAVANQDQPLVAAILDVIADQPVGDRPVSANDLVAKCPHPDFVAAQEAFKSFDRDFQKFLIVRRTFFSPTAGAIGRVQAALDG